MPFNENHKRYILAGFQYIDKLLAQASTNLGPADDALLFPPCVPDATPTQVQVIADYIASFRSVSRRFLEAAQARIEEPSKGALWSLKAALDFVWVSLADMEPKRLNGYGALDEDAAEETERALAELQAILRQLMEYLQQGLGGDIGARLEKLDQTRDEILLLRELERIVRDRGLVEFRASLLWLTERFERPWLEVAFFGRVSSGKSSLVNAILGRDILPTGVTPVTAVPTRIIPGRSSRATVSFARLSSRQIELAELAEYATEERNPGNEKRVVDILVEVPSSRCADGVCFVDTPGLGSLATAGASQSMAYLPRTDIGVLLMDAAGSLSEEDISVARAIVESGAILVPVLSKADLLAPQQLQKMTDYVRSQLCAALGMNPAVIPVSVMPGSSHLASQWFERELAPRLSERRSLLSSSLKRKVGALREAVAAALEVRMRHSDPNGSVASGLAATTRTLGDARNLLARSKQRVIEVAERTSKSSSTLVDAAAAALAESWAGDSAALLVAREADRLGGEFSTLVEDARRSLEQALEQASKAAPLIAAESGSLPDLDARPLFDPQYLFRDLQVRPGFRALFGQAGRREDARRKLLRAIGPQLSATLEGYSGALKRWAERSLASLEKAFEAAAAAFSALERFSSREVSSAGEHVQNALIGDLEMLRAWNDEAHTPGKKNLRVSAVVGAGTSQRST